MDTIASVLRSARKKIESPGNWAQRSPGYEGKHCAIMAIQRTKSNDKVRGAAIQHFKKTIRRASIANWNDNPNRTHDQVLRAYDKAIRTAR